MIHLVHIYLDSSVGVGNRLRGVRRGVRCSILDKQQILSILRMVQTGSESYLTSYSRVTVGSLNDDETAGWRA